MDVGTRTLNAFFAQLINSPEKVSNTQLTTLRYNNNNPNLRGIGLPEGRLLFLLGSVVDCARLINFNRE